MRSKGSGRIKDTCDKWCRGISVKFWFVNDEGWTKERSLLLVRVRINNRDLSLVQPILPMVVSHHLQTRTSLKSIAAACCPYGVTNSLQNRYGCSLTSHRTKRVPILEWVRNTIWFHSVGKEWKSSGNHFQSTSGNHTYTSTRR